LPVNSMQCVAQGAALKAAGIAKPGTTTDPNGYGTLVDPNAYYSVIPINSYYPITSEPMEIIHSDLRLAACPFPWLQSAVIPRPDQSHIITTIWVSMIVLSANRGEAEN